MGSREFPSVHSWMVGDPELAADSFIQMLSRDGDSTLKMGKEIIFVLLGE